MVIEGEGTVPFTLFKLEFNFLPLYLLKKITFSKRVKKH